MNVAFQKPWTLEAFLRWEAKQELRFEFDGFRPIAMASGTAAHAAIQRNLITALAIGLRGKPCQPYGSELKIRVGELSIRYPDAFVVCTPIAPQATVVDEPVVIFDILSESSATSDFVTKRAEYQATPSVKRYVVLAQSGASAAVFSCGSGEWATTLPTGSDAILDMPEVGLQIPLSEIYAGIETEPAADDTGA
jgi:Uma2 family endonuclease